MSLYSPETQARLDILRAKALAGDFSLEDQKEAITLMRQDRKAASETKTKAKKAPPPNIDLFLDELRAK